MTNESDPKSPCSSLPKRPSLDLICFSVFTFLWGAATVFHQLSLQRLLISPVCVLLTLLGVGAMLMPWRLRSLVALSCGQLLEIFAYAPTYSNHWLMTAAVNLIVVMAYSVAALRSSRLRPRLRDFVALFAPAARSIFLTLYFWAVFHKLNTGFFRPESSCAAELIGVYQNSFLSVLPRAEWVTEVAIWVTLLTEGVIPLLLTIRKTRPWGVLIGAGFHFIIGFNTYEAYYNFSSALLAIYFLFVDPQLVDKLVQLGRRRGEQLYTTLGSPRNLMRLGDLKYFVGLFSAFLLLWLGLWGRDSRFFNPLVLSMWGVLGLLFLGLCGLGTLLHRQPVSVWGGNLYLPSSPLLLLIPVLYFLNGTQPYLGGKSEQALAMFSNLVTEGGVSNHYLIREPIALLPYQEKIVRIHESDDPYLLQLRDENRGMVWFEFRDYLQRNPETRVTFTVAGQRHDLQRAADDERFVEPTPFLHRKWLYFRHPDLNPAASRCLH